MASVAAAVVVILAVVTAAAFALDVAVTVAVNDAGLACAIKLLVMLHLKSSQQLLLLLMVLLFIVVDVAIKALSIAHGLGAFDILIIFVATQEAFDASDRVAAAFRGSNDVIIEFFFEVSISAAAIFLAGKEPGPL